MTKRVLLAGLLGGIAMFAWTSLAHMVLPLGGAGVKEIPNEQGVLAAMHSSLGEAHGFYFFPGTALGSDASMQQKRAAMDQYAQKLAAIMAREAKTDKDLKQLSWTSISARLTENKLWPNA